MLRPRRKRNTRGECRANSGGEKSNNDEKPKIGPKKPEMEPKVNHDGMEQKSSGSKINAEMDQKPTGSKSNAGVDRNASGSKSNSGMDQKPDKEEVNLSVQMEKLATITMQDKFLNGGRINDCDGVIIRLENATIDDPDFYAAWGLDQYDSNLLIMPVEFLAKMMIGRSFRLSGPIRNWMRGRNRYGRQADLQIQLKRVTLKQSLDDLLVFAFVAVGAL